MRLDLATHRAERAGRRLDLTPKEEALLVFFLRHAGEVLSRTRIYEQVWGEDSVGCDNTVMVHIRHIREKVEDDPTTPKLLQTVKGLGYRLVKLDE